MINNLLSQLEEALKLYKKEPSMYNLKRYFRKFRLFNLYGQDSVYKAEFHDGYELYLTVGTLSDANDYIKVKYPERAIKSIVPINTGALIKK